MKQKIDAYIDGKEREFLDALARLIAIPSERGTEDAAAPYGAEPLRALREGLAIAAEWGLAGENWENTVAVVDLLPENDDHLHILAHLDVVPAGEGWSRAPFALTVENGQLYGRGVADDKGPALAALLALRCVRELGAPLKRNCRLILGTDEERGSSDIARYYAAHPYGVHSFTPDADYPVIHIEKGGYKPVLSARWTSGSAPRVTAVKGGERVNVVPADASAAVLGLDEHVLRQACARAAEQTGAAFTLRQEGQSATIFAAGTGAHAAHPEEGNNALTALLALLAALPLNEEDGGTQAVRGLAKLFPHGDFFGAALGVAQEDDLSGALTLSLTRCDLTQGALSAQFDARVPLCVTAENCRAVCQAACAAQGLTAEGEMRPAHHVPAESPFLQTLLDSLEAFTGQRGEPLAIGGGTYVHDIPGGVAFGCTFPGVETRIHGADETIPLADLMVSAKIFAKAILDLCGENG